MVVAVSECGSAASVLSANSASQSPTRGSTLRSVHDAGQERQLLRAILGSRSGHHRPLVPFQRFGRRGQQGRLADVGTKLVEKFLG